MPMPAQFKVAQRLRRQKNQLDNWATLCAKRKSKLEAKYAANLKLLEEMAKVKEDLPSDGEAGLDSLDSENPVPMEESEEEVLIGS